MRRGKWTKAVATSYPADSSVASANAAITKLVLWRLQAGVMVKTIDVHANYYKNLQHSYYCNP